MTKNRLTSENSMTLMQNSGSALRTKQASGSFLVLTAISFIAGTILILFLRIVLEITGNTAYFLLFNFDYIPVVNTLQSVPFSGFLFHYITCFVSVVVLFYFLRRFRWQRRYWLYILVYTIGGGALFFLTALSPKPPEASDWASWMYWTVGHALYGCVVALLIKRRIKE